MGSVAFPEVTSSYRVDEVRRGLEMAERIGLRSLFVAPSREAVLFNL